MDLVGAVPVEESVCAERSAGRWRLAPLEGVCGVVQDKERGCVAAFDEPGGRVRGGFAGWYDVLELLVKEGLGIGTARFGRVDGVQLDGVNIRVVGRTDSLDGRKDGLRHEHGEGVQSVP